MNPRAAIFRLRLLLDSVRLPVDATFMVLEQRGFTSQQIDIRTGLSTTQSRPFRSWHVKIMAHDRTRRCVANNRPETRTLESGCVTRPGGAGAKVCVERIGFESWGSCLSGSDQGCFNQGRRQALSTPAFPHIKTGNRPHRHVVDTPQSPSSIQPR